MAELTYPGIYDANHFADWDKVAGRRKPMIAAVAGFALGGGCEFAMMCDFIIAADTAKFGQPEIKLGVMPGMGGTQRLTRLIGRSKAMEMCLTGRMMGAEEAERSGLVARVVPAAELMAEALKTADIIASMSLPIAMMTKETVNRADEIGARGGHPVRASPVPRHVRHRRSEGRHEGLRREAPAPVREPVGGRHRSPGEVRAQIRPRPVIRSGMVLF